MRHHFRLVFGAITRSLFWLVILLPAVVFAQELATATADPGVPEWAPASIPVILFFAKWAVENLIPDALIKRIRDEWIPFLAPFAGIAIAAVQDGNMTLSHGVWGAIVGLAGIGLHQMAKQSGIHGAIFKKSPG